MGLNDRTRHMPGQPWSRTVPANGIIRMTAGFPLTPSRPGPRADEFQVIEITIQPSLQCSLCCWIVDHRASDEAAGLRSGNYLTVRADYEVAGVRDDPML